MTKKYVDFLHSIDNRVENIEYSNRIKPYIGIILEVGEFKYYVPISSVKEKHYKMKNSMDLYKIRNGNKILGVLNINNMIPIKEKYVKRLEYKYIQEYRQFKNTIEKEKYISLLSKELRIINKKQEEITYKANELYNYVLNNPKSNIAKRSCDFRLLERRIVNYNE